MKRIWKRGAHGLFIPAQVPVHPGKPNYLLLDNFAGSGALAAHVPDYSSVDASWSIVQAAFSNLSGGLLSADGVNHYTRAVINVGAADYQIEFKARYVQVNAQEVTGIMYRSNSAGTDYYRFTMIRSDARSSAQILANGVPSGLMIPGNSQANANYCDFTGVNGNYYIWKLLVSGADLWVYDETENLMLRFFGALKTTQNYLGPLNYSKSASATCDYIKV